MAYEVLPDSGKVIALDVDLPVTQALHIFYEQAIRSRIPFERFGPVKVVYHPKNYYIGVQVFQRNLLQLSALMLTIAAITAGTVQRLKTFKAKLVVFPRRSRKTKTLLWPAWNYCIFAVYLGFALLNYCYLIGCFKIQCIVVTTSTNTLQSDGASSSVKPERWDKRGELTH